MSPNHDKEMPPKAPILNAVGNQLLLLQERRGDDKLEQARKLVTSEVRAAIRKDDLDVIDDKIASALDMRFLLNTKSGLRKFLHAVKYHKVANGVYKHVKCVSDRAYVQFQYQLTSLEAEDIYRTARSLYRCWLSCEDAFPSSLTQDKWVVDAWNEAYWRWRTDAHPNSLRQDEEIKCDSMKLLADMKTKTKCAVDSSFQFETGQAADSIGRNASLAQTLLDKTTFIYQDFGSGERPRYPYRNPIIQKVVNITWFQSPDDIGIVFYQYFDPIPLGAIALVLTMIECCIYEWNTGIFKESNWKEVDYRANYLSHLTSLGDLDTHGPDNEGRDLLRKIQDNLLRTARKHAGAPPDPPACQRRLSLNALDAAILEDPSEYDQLSTASSTSE